MRMLRAKIRVSNLKTTSFLVSPPCVACNCGLEAPITARLFARHSRDGLDIWDDRRVLTIVDDAKRNRSISAVNQY